jgi:ketosteroid isomerase-like protein
MKKLFLVILLLSGFSSLAQSQSKDETEIQNLIQNSFDELFSNLDAERLGDFYTDDFLLLEQGEIWDNAIILGYFERAIQNPNRPVRTNRFEFIQTKVEGNRGWVGYWNFATLSRDGQVIQELKWLESATAVKTDKGWRLDMLHSTRVEKE